MIKVLITQFIEKFLKKTIGCYLFYLIILKNKFFTDLINFLNLKRIEKLAINVSNILAAKKLNKLARNAKNVKELIDIVFTFSFSLEGLSFPFNYNIDLKPTQVKKELIEFLNLLNNYKPKVIFEIGTYKGGTLFLFSKIATKDSLIISIDLPGKTTELGGYDKHKISLYQSFKEENQMIYLLRRDSHKLSTFKYIEQILNKCKLDFLFIDGDHSYDGVKKDFEMYNNLVKKNGIIAFHDIVPGPKKNVGGVPEFWKEIKQRYDSIEIVNDWKQGGLGIGYIIKK